MGRRDAKKYIFDQETGKFDYIGKKYAIMADEKDIKRLQVGGLLISLVMLGLFVICGLFTYGGMNCAYVMGPYVLLIIPVIWMFTRFLSLIRKTDELTEAGNRLMMHLHWTSLAASALGLAAAIGEVVFSLQHGFVQGDVPFIAMMLLEVPLGIIVFVLVRKCPTEQLFMEDDTFDVSD